MTKTQTIFKTLYSFLVFFVCQVNIAQAKKTVSKLAEPKPKKTIPNRKKQKEATGEGRPGKG